MSEDYYIIRDFSDFSSFMIMEESEYDLLLANNYLIQDPKFKSFIINSKKLDKYTGAVHQLWIINCLQNYPLRKTVEIIKKEISLNR